MAKRPYEELAIGQKAKTIGDNMSGDNLATLPGFKDGDDEDFDNVTGGVNIEPVDNGWVVNVINDEGDIRKVYEYKNGALMMKFLTEVLGVK